MDQMIGSCLMLSYRPLKVSAAFGVVLWGCEGR